MFCVTPSTKLVVPTSESESEFPLFGGNFFIPAATGQWYCDKQSEKWVVFMT